MANIAAAVKALELEKLITQAVIGEIDKKRRLINFAEINTPIGNGDNRFQRAGTTKHHPATLAGKHNLLGTNNGRKILLHVQCQPTPGKTLLTNSRRTRYSLKKRLSWGDADREMRNALVTAGKTFQMDLVHLIRDTMFNLWRDHQLTLSDRKQMIK